MTTSFTLLDNLRDPVRHWKLKNNEVVDVELSSMTIEMKLTDFTIEYYDWMDAHVSTYEELIKIYPEHQVVSLFRCLFTNLQDKIDIDTASLYVKSVNIWFDKNIAQIKMIHLSDTDYSMFYPYLKITGILSKPDRSLYYAVGI